MKSNDKLRTVILQPISLCNLNCKYCYLSESSRRNPIKMKSSVLEEILKKVLSYPDTQNPLQLVWHAGEPLTARIEFYENANKLIKKHRPEGFIIEQQIQTNGVLINDSWCDFIKSSDIKIGVSIDGPKHIHDANRVNWRGKGSHELTMRGIGKLNEYDIPFHALFVVSDISLDYPDEIFHFFMENQIGYIGFNIEELTGANTVTSLAEKKHIEYRYEFFLSRLMDLWIKYYPKIRIREFERLKAYIHKKTQDNKFIVSTIESSKKGILTFNLDGGIVPFSPDLASGIPENSAHFVIENIQKIESLAEIYTNEKFLRFYDSIQKGVKKCKEECQYFDLCGGGHPTNKYFENKSFETSETNFCQLYFQRMIDTILEKFEGAQNHGA